jgi:hypothetical protein
VYSSESDRPFDFFAVPYPGQTASPTAGEFARLIRVAADAPVEVRSLESFFARHTTTSDPYDVKAQRIRPRYEQLVRLLSQHLSHTRVYRIGRIEIDCYVAGLDGHGHLAGLRTVAIET